MGQKFINKELLFIFFFPPSLTHNKNTGKIIHPRTHPLLLESLPPDTSATYATLAILKPPIGCYTWRVDQGFRFDDLMKDFNQGSRCEMEERLKGLEASPLPYK
ncbi:hypothetical protein Tco_0265902 [Tanacetum coccineum]